jgi:molecular chaperone GrpE
MAEKTIETLEQDLKAEHDLHLRALADFDNYRRRIDRERARFGTEALRDFLIGLLDIVDDLERFLGSVEDEKSPFIDGIRVSHQKMMDLLGKEGVRPFESLGKAFDPAFHEVEATAPVEKKTPGTIVQETRRGYTFKDDLLRPARVVVAA